MFEWFNIYGLVFMFIIMIPNIVYAVRNRNGSDGNGPEKDGSEDKWKNRTVGIIEQIGRFGCLAFMIFNIPGTWFGWPSDEAFAVYLIADVVLIAAYCAFWIILRKNHGVFRALALSVIPSVIFLFSGIMSRSIPLILSALLFAPAHILISYKNAE